MGPVAKNSIREPNARPHAAGRNLGSDATTHGVRIVVEPSYVPEHSDPFDRRYVFAYRIRIVNEGERWVKLLRRRWVIVDAHGARQEVEGEGVIGAQPELEPGQSFEYSSHCSLTTPWGTMEGAYTMRFESGEEFLARVARFYLVAQEEIAANV